MLESAAIEISENEASHLNATFAQLCSIYSPSRQEHICANWVENYLVDLGLSVRAAEKVGDSGNLLTQIEGDNREKSVFFCAHLDTVNCDVAIVPVLDEGIWRNSNPGILGADNKAAVAVLLQAAKRWVQSPPPVSVELLFTVCEEDGLEGAKTVSRDDLLSTYGFIYDHATPIGEVITRAPYYYRVKAEFKGKAAHAGIHPEEGRSAIVAAGRALANIPHGRIDDETTVNIGEIEGGSSSWNVVPDKCSVAGEVRSLDRVKAEKTLTEIIDHFYDAASLTECDVSCETEREFSGYRLTSKDTPVAVGCSALRRAGFQPLLRATGGGSDANVFNHIGIPCVNLANGTDDCHRPSERVTEAALTNMLKVTFAIVSEAAAETV